MSAEVKTATMEEKMNKGFDAWFAELQKLTARPLEAEDWPERWFDGYTPEEALAAGPEG